LDFLEAGLSQIPVSDAIEFNPTKVGPFDLHQVVPLVGLISGTVPNHSSEVILGFFLDPSVLNFSLDAIVMISVGDRASDLV